MKSHSAAPIRILCILGLQAIALGLLLNGLNTPSPVEAEANVLGLPPGFIDEVAVDGLLAPRDFVFAPDGRIFIAERGISESNDINFASIRVFNNGTLAPTRTASFNVCGDGERGLLGVALDPDFASNGYMYVYFTRQSIEGQGLPTCAYDTYSNTQAAGPRNVVARVTISGDVAISGSERILIDHIASDSGIHNAGDLQFGADGYLYVSAGDSDLVPSPAQFTNTLNGKILRIKPLPGDAGYSTTGNPFDTAPGAWRCGANPEGSSSGPCREIFAYGFRNPFRFTIPPSTSTPYAGDVGGGAWEEVDLVVAGNNYGWPSREGPCSAGVTCTLPDPTPPTMTNPIYAYSHDAEGCPMNGAAIIAGDFYTGTTYPVQYHNGMFFADVVCGFVRYIKYDNQAATWTAYPFGTGSPGIVGLRLAADGNLYYLTSIGESIRNSQLRRIRYDPGANPPPIAVLSVSPLNGPLNTTYTFSAIGSYDPNNNLPLIYTFDFGDGAITTTSRPTVTHVYTAPVNRLATLTVTDGGVPVGQSSPVYVTVYPGNVAPTATIRLTNTTSLTRSSYYAGDTWQFGAVNPGDDQAFPAAPFLWEVAFHHREHTHPFLSGITGSGSQFSVPVIGETDPVVWYRVRLYLKDARGQTTVIERDVLPVTRTLTLRTALPNGVVILEGGTYSSPLTVSRVVNLNIDIGVPSPQPIGGLTYFFSSWSNGGGQNQVIAVPPAATTYTATLVLLYRVWLPVVLRGYSQ